MLLTNDPLLPIVLGRHHGDRLLRRLTDTGARFIVVGGCAVAAWGRRPFGEVEDLDLLLEPGIENARAVLAGLLAVGLPVAVSAQALAAAGQRIRLKDAGFQAELRTPHPGFQFAPAYDEAARYRQFGVEIRIASVATLVSLKKRAISELAGALDRQERDLLALLAA